ncbi:MAG: hypothetical protein EAZ99_07885 [Alphaproteobacteria bacterium]|nr:MAG: hypothetical protein EAZ99_07885 [Alphaproteobacteria bacterium]
MTPWEQAREAAVTLRAQTLGEVRADASGARRVDLAIEPGDWPASWDWLPGGTTLVLVVVATEADGAPISPQPQSMAHRALAQAHTLARDQKFQEWIAAEYPIGVLRPYEGRAPSPAEVCATRLRAAIGIDTRAQLLIDPCALQRWHALLTKWADHNGKRHWMPARLMPLIAAFEPEEGDGQ